MRYQYYEGATTEINGRTLELFEMEHHVLLQRRKELKMTQQQVADKAGIQLRQYQRLEQGERNISGSSGRIMLSICKALRLDPYLFLGEGNEKPEVKHVVLPPIDTQGINYVIPSIAYYDLVSAVPRGMVCVDDEIMSCLRRVYGNDMLEIKTDHNSVDLYANNSFPYWRVVSYRGYLFNSLGCSKERQKKLLEDEGIAVSQMGDKDSYRVDDFDFCKFDMNNVKITVLKTEAEIIDRYSSIINR